MEACGLKLLVIGAGGQVGDKLVRSALSKGIEVYGTFQSRPPTAELAGASRLDKRNESEVNDVLSRFRPDWVVDTAALHNVDYCESHPDEAKATNTIGTGNLAKGCRERGSCFTFVSTDFVFDGEGAPYTEESKPNPLSAYAQSKLDGERIAFESNPGATVVVRPSVVYSWVGDHSHIGSSSGKPLNFAAWLVSQLILSKTVNIVDDQMTSPTLADDLAAAILAIISSSKFGLFHTAGATPLTRFEFSIKVADKLNLDRNLVKPVSSSALKQVARRPSNSSLVSYKIKREVGRQMMDIDEALEVFSRQAKEAEAR